jgi:hypothetical protein
MAFTVHWLTNEIEDLKQDEWIHFARKLHMLVEELQAFQDVITAFEKLRSSGSENIKKLNEYQKEKEQVQSSEKKAYGLLTKVPKEEILKSLDEKISKLEATIATEKQLTAIVGHAIRQHEIKVVKARKKARFEEVLKEFAAARLKKLKKETEFWERIGEGSDGQELVLQIDNADLSEQRQKPDSPKK